MKIKNKMIIDDNFVEAFFSLLSIPMSAKQCLEVSSSVDEIAGQRQIVQRTRKAIIERFCKKDEAGKAIEDEKGQVSFENNDLKETCLYELKEVFEEEIDISLKTKVKIDKAAVMTPMKVKLLKDIIEIDI